MQKEPRGPVWGIETDDLNATLLAWPAGEGTPEHVNHERDVVVVVVAGSLTVTIDGHARDVTVGDAVAIPKGRTRALRAGADGARYVSVHTRRPPLQIQRTGRLQSPPTPS